MYLKNKPPWEDRCGHADSLTLCPSLRQEEKGTTEDEMAGWHRWLDGRESELRELVMDREAWRAAVHGVTKSWTRLSNWTELNCSVSSSVSSWSAYRFLRRQVWWSVFLSLSEFSSLLWSTESKPFNIVYESDGFPVIPLLSLWSNKCWQFHLWFLCLF